MANSKPLIFIVDFFGTVKERGIAAYVRDIESISGPFARVICLRAPDFVKRLPQPLQNVLMVACEQLVAPIWAAALRPKLIIFPYNSSSFILSLFRRTVCVIHDLIPYRERRRGSKIAFYYVACSARWHAYLKRRLVAVSPFTARTLNSLPRFKSSPIITIPNCFVLLEPVPSDIAQQLPFRRITLISGIGPNKAFAGALELIAHAHNDADLNDVAFDVVGFGSEHKRAAAMIDEAKARGIKLPPITVHSLLPRTELDALLSANAVTWAHSLAEGFGRVVVEGRMAGRPVVMSALPVFRALRDPYTFSYSNSQPNAFVQALRDAFSATDSAQPYRIIDQLRSDATAGINRLLTQ